MNLVWIKQAIANLNAVYDYVVETAPESAGIMEMGRLGRVKGTREVVIPLSLPEKGTRWRGCDSTDWGDRSKT